MPIESADPTVIPPVEQPEIPAAKRWVDRIFVEAPRSAGPVAVTADLVNYAPDAQGNPIAFDASSARRIKVRDLYSLIACRHCGKQAAEHDAETGHQYEPRNMIVAVGVEALYDAIKEIDRLDKQRRDLEAQLPATATAAAEARSRQI